MNIETFNGFLMSEYLSNIELYFTEPGNIDDNMLIVTGDDFKHIVKVMRHQPGDEIYVTSGEGKIYRCVINSIQKDLINCSIIQSISYKNGFSNITSCLPKLKSQDRFEFALEKCVEMGITNFIVFESKRTIARGNKIERWEKIALAAMKQSLRSFLPEIRTAKNLGEILNMQGEKLVLEQNSANDISGIELSGEKKYFFIFGPEGGLTENEIQRFPESNRFKLASNRLRSETAIIKCAALL